MLPIDPGPGPGAVPSPLALAALGELAGAAPAGHDAVPALEQLVHLASGTVPGVVAVSVTLLRGATPTSPASSSPLALECDTCQYELGDGPCLQATRDRHVVAVPDVEETPWRQYARVAAAAGSRSSISLPLARQDQVLGALNVYGAEPRSLGPVAEVLCHAYAAHASAVLASTRALQMEEAMSSRAVIEQAKGIVMSQRHCDPEEAFRVLVRGSTRTNRKLREIAVEVVEAVQAPRG